MCESMGGLAFWNAGSMTKSSVNHAELTADGPFQGPPLKATGFAGGLFTPCHVVTPAANATPCCCCVRKWPKTKFDFIVISSSEYASGNPVSSL